MKIHKQLDQRSWEWFRLRAGKLTASEMGRLITDKGAVRAWKADMPNSLLHRKLAEKWRGAPIESFGGNRQTDQGTLYEGQARAYFAALLEADIETVGGIESDDSRRWCSPDGIIGEGKGLEIKCPNADTHVGWLLAGGVPPEHVLQVQFGLHLTGWPVWNFLSYCKDMPHLYVAVEPESEIQAVIGEAIGEFFVHFDEAWVQLCDLNGGPPEPPKRDAFVPSPGPVKFSWEGHEMPFDNIP